MAELSKNQAALLAQLQDAYPKTVPRGELMRALGIDRDAFRQLIQRLRRKGIKIKMVHRVEYGLDEDV